MISLAEVRSIVDPSRSGLFWAFVDADSEQVEVYYVSPYGSNDTGAFVAVPEVGTQILVCKPEGYSSWYYMGTTFSSPEPRTVVPLDSTSGEIEDMKLMPLERVDPEMYKARGAPMKYIFKSPAGGGITISDEYNPFFVNKNTTVHSSKNKIVQLHDAPSIDSIILDTGNGSRITLTDDPQNQSMAARSIQVESVGPQKYINKESQTDIVVHEAGRELQLLNIANGVPFEDDEEINAGNVNIQSRWKDVNVFTQAEEGRIFIECLNENGKNQQIVIETNGDGTDGITIKTKGSINLAADSDINLQAGRNMNIQCQKYSVNCSKVDVQSSGQVDIDGSKIYLASNTASPTAPNIPNPQSTYDNTGVTTY